MKEASKHGVIFYGIIVSAIHFTTASLLSSGPSLMLPPEDMVGSGHVKPNWPASRLRDLVEGTGHILSFPATWVHDWLPNMAGLDALLVFVVSSCCWGFGSVFIARWLLSLGRTLHEPRAP